MFMYWGVGAWACWERPDAPPRLLASELSATNDLHEVVDLQATTRFTFWSDDLEQSLHPIPIWGVHVGGEHSIVNTVLRTEHTNNNKEQKRVIL
jgi:hypothetical protein